MSPRTRFSNRLITLTAVLAIVAGCDGEKTEVSDEREAPAAVEKAPEPEQVKPEQAKSEAAPKARGKFVGQIGDEKIEMEVDCKHLDKPFFTFQSDKFDHKDSDGDGKVLSGMEHEGKFVLTYIVDDFTLSSPGIETFEKNEKGAKGSGTLRSEDAMQKKAASFEVTCP